MNDISSKLISGNLSSTISTARSTLSKNIFLINQMQNTSNNWNFHTNLEMDSILDNRLTQHSISRSISNAAQTQANNKNKIPKSKSSFTIKTSKQ